MSDSYDDYECKIQLAEHAWEVRTEHDRAVQLGKAYERGWNAALAQREWVPKALVLADALEELDVQFSHTGLCGEAADELRRLHVWEKTYEAVCDERDAIIKDADKAHALLRWVETEMRYAGWDIRLNDQHGRTDVYEAIKEFLS